MARAGKAGTAAVTRAATEANLNRVAAPGGPPPVREQKRSMSMAFDASQEPDDDALIARFAQGDQAAARLLAARLTPGVLALAMRLLRDRAESEDVAQEAMLRLWKIAPDWESGRAKPSKRAARLVVSPIAV